MKPEMNFEILAKGETMQELLHIWERIQGGRLPQSMNPIIKNAILALCDEIKKEII